MTEEKNCDNCNFSYLARDELHLIPGREFLQHCASEQYNAANYTHEMLMEDRSDGHCRFWTPKIPEGTICVILCTS